MNLEENSRKSWKNGKKRIHAKSVKSLGLIKKMLQEGTTLVFATDAAVTKTKNVLHSAGPTK